MVVLKMQKNSFFKNIYLIIKNGGYHSYFLVGPPLPVKKVREIYMRTNHDFIVGWDMFYMNLTLEDKRYKPVIKFLLFVYEYIRHVYVVINNSRWVYKSSMPNGEDTYEVYFRNNDRVDQNPFCGYEALNITQTSKNDFINSIKAILPCFSFRKLFKKKIIWHATKLRFCNLPKEVILEECRSVEYRALFYFTIKNDINVKISWRNSSTLLYSKDELKNNKNLDMPVELIRPDFIDNNIQILNKPIIIEDDLLIIVPSTFRKEEIISWVHKTVNHIKARKYYFSIHPSSSHLIKPINDLKIGKIDYKKDKYLMKYRYFSGTYSTLIQNAKKSGGITYPLAFNEHELEYMDAQMSNITIYKAF
jgi:hypothetical protein|tara:strand:+ start:11345 stop:12430 length:1086 start_codon:yes stop_codon:yes gene_type:complete